MYIKIYKELSEINNKEKTLSNQNLINYFFYKISNFITPIFIILRFSPNLITILNFCIGIFSCLLIMFNQNYLVYGIIVFFIFRIFDCVDGSIARYEKKTFFGKFLDATFDAIIHPLFFISIAFYFFNFSENKNLLIFGVFSSLLFLVEILILDKFGSLVRWCNEQNSNDHPPYIRRKNFYRLNLILRDLIFLGLIFLMFLNEYSLLFGSIYIAINCCLLLSAIFNISMHVFFAKKYLNFEKK